MIFNSFEFLAFLAVFFILYFAVIRNSRGRIILSLVGSYFFYGWWDWRFLSLILFSTLVDYTLGARIHASDDDSKKKRYVIISLVTNLGLLAVFKYFNFFIDSFINISSAMGVGFNLSTLNIILPVGISFYTFQTLSYTIDIYRGHLKPEPDFLIYSTYVAFFPQLVAGPIVRAADLLPQFRKRLSFERSRLISGTGQILLGFFKKVAVADTLATLVDKGFEAPDYFPAINLVLFVFFYAFQIYCDFSGYSDIAIGTARILGYDFPANFNFPYFARNFSDLWKRWHISLSSWLRDYLYISLGGNRKGAFNTQKNLMLTMLLGGLWHGANWTFVFWGFLHGLYLVLQRVFNPLTSFFERLLPRPLFSLLSMVLTFSMVCFAWIFFRAQTFSDAWLIITKIFTAQGLAPGNLLLKFDTLSAMPPLLVLIAGEIIHQKYPLDELIQKRPLIRALGFAALLWMILLFGTFGSNQFIYFQF